MPIPLVPVIAGVSNLIGQGVNALTQGTTNRKSREFTEHMYDKQRADSLADYTMQNEYNSPAAQMQRLKSAGLNPNLVYGNGSATSTAAPVRSSSPGSWSPSAPRVDVGGAFGAGLSAYYDTKLKEASLDNLKKQNDVIAQDALVKAAQLGYIQTQTQAAAQGIKGSEFDLSLKNDLRAGQLELQQMSLDKLHADTMNVLTDVETKQLMQAPNLAKTIEDILRSRSDRMTAGVQRDQMRAAIDNMKKDGSLKDLELSLRKMGINPNDPMYMRMIGQFINAVDPSKVAEKAGSAVGSLGRVIGRFIP